MQFRPILEMSNEIMMTIAATVLDIAPYKMTWRL